MSVLRGFTVSDLGSKDIPKTFSSSSSRSSPIGTSSFLSSGKRQWVAGPTPPTEVQCATGISTTSFLIFGGTSVRQYDDTEGWVEDWVWPDLLLERTRPGCATLHGLCIVAGGRDDMGEVLQSVEVINIALKSLGPAKDMLRPRAYFNLIVLGSTLLAFGGYNETSIEMWGGLSEPWKQASPSLRDFRTKFSSSALSDSMCLEGPPSQENITLPQSWGFVLLGGLDSSDNGLSSVEVVGLDKCTVPHLPELRYNHGSFLTEWGALATCGGYWAGKPWSSDCLVLNSTSRQWERDVLGPLLGEYVLGVIILESGTYMIHNTTSSFLPSSHQDWIAGPSPPEKAECATKISASSFLVFSSTSAHQFDSNVAGPTNAMGWLDDAGWPDLKEERHGPACATLGSLCVVAGGRDALDEVLKSVEIIFLETKALENAQDMLKPRHHFSLVVLGTTLLAFGGSNETSIELWEGEGKSWKEASISLANARRQFSALSYSDLECVDGSWPAHSCPTVDEDACVFPFTNGRPHKNVCILSWLIVSCRISNLLLLCQ